MADIPSISKIYIGDAEMKFGVDTSDATATPETILEGYTAYVNGVLITGTLVPISQEQYDAIVAERDTLYTQNLQQTKEITQLNNRLATLEPDYEYIEEQLDSSYQTATEINGEEA